MSDNFEVAASLPYAVAIIDLSHITGGKTITNSVEEVVDILGARRRLDGKRRLVYCDTTGTWDEILYRREPSGLCRFIGFAPIRCASMTEALEHCRGPRP